MEVIIDTDRDGLDAAKLFRQLSPMSMHVLLAHHNIIASYLVPNAVPKHESIHCDSFML